MVVYCVLMCSSGHLIDIITYNKGPKGFKAFMEVIEYEFPYVFAHIMGTTPSTPPPGKCLMSGPHILLHKQLYLSLYTPVLTGLLQFVYFQ